MGSCGLPRPIADRRPAPPFNRSVSRHDGSQDRSSSLGALALVVALGLGAWAGNRWVAASGATRVVARASVFGTRGCGCRSTGPKSAGTDHGNVLGVLGGTG